MTYTPGDIDFSKLFDGDQSFHRFIGNLPFAVFACDVDGFLTYYNPAAAEMWGQKPIIGKEKWMGTTKLFRADNSILPSDECPLALAIRGDKETNRELTIEGRLGQRHHVISHPTIIRDKAGIILGGIDALTIFHPTPSNVSSDQKAVEEKIASLAAIVESSDDAIIGKRLDGIVTSWNKSAQRIFGYTEREMIGQPITKLIPPDRIEEEPLIIARLKKGERVDHFETQRMTKDGRLLDISLTISAVRDKEGNIIGASKIARDITEQRKSERKLIESEEKFRLLANMAQYVWTADANGKINYVNESLSTALNISMEEISEKGFTKFVHSEDLPMTESEWKQSVLAGTPFQAEHRFKFQSKYRWQVTHAMPQRDQFGAITMWVGTSSDVHDLKTNAEELEVRVDRRTHELRLAIEDLARSNSELGAFTYIASHDLQEPLRKIQTFVSLIIKNDDANLSSIGRDYLKRMQNASRRMQGLIHDLLMYSRLNTQTKLFESVNLSVLLDDVLHELKEQVAEKGMTFDIGQLPSLEVIPFQFRQLFTNLISNSLKFARAGIPPRVTIRAEEIMGKSITAFKAFPEMTYYRFIVEDNGIGFDLKYKDLIFQVFQRLHGKNEYAGTGIGLAICKKVVENHAGFISATGKEDIGATIEFYIPEHPLTQESGNLK